MWAMQETVSPASVLCLRVARIENILALVKYGKLNHETIDDLRNPDSVCRDGHVLDIE
jgi:hypothetical protein